ncbi:MAG: 30S ribosomal protein S17 [Candidatus Edwardsbacteria bacterium]|nr:30S ribosomal protein S17 [Candidatus Edwardsbacteria bacterium]MBU1576747.1 30S ribosomal protein S17 [Candidatus Edwardsbacteria bacterium]MBU2463335.1 30S ribosomal protein S17 [Candidatus Edwardsbacteria bacterium]MBU2594786.1 30S ribosomal protein S17 [Candidatus Edwardsbacteria bacterium]
MAERNLRKTRMGKVVGDKMNKTIIVAVERRVKHPLYSRVVKRTTKYYAHSEDQSAKLGDTVRIIETKPISKTKRWRLVEVMEKAK